MALEFILLALILLALVFPKSRDHLGRLVCDGIDSAHYELLRMRPLFWIVVCIAVVGFGYAFGVELAWLAAMDVATYVEIVVAVSLANAIQNVRSFRAHVVAIVRRALNQALAPMRATLRRRRARPRPRLPAQDDDVSEPRFAFA